MKKIFKCIFVGLLGSLLTTACQQEEMPSVAEVIMDSVAIVPAYVDAEVVCKFRSNFTIEHVILYLSADPDFSKVEKIILTKELDNQFAGKLTSLIDGMTYYVRYEISNTWSQVMLDEVEEFTTHAFAPPVMAATEITDLTFNSAIIEGKIIRDGGKKIQRCGVVYSTSANPTLENTQKVIVVDTENSIFCYLGGLSKDSVYYARTFAENEMGITYGDEVRFEVDTLWEGYDLGLSVKWAHVNIGATYPEEAGDYFAWGEVSPKAEYLLANYERSGEYCFADGRKVLESQDDAATANWGGKWRMPTPSEIDELCSKCNWKWKEINGVGGYVVSNTQYGAKSIFIPLVGYKNGDKLNSYNDYGYYWSCKVNTDADDAEMLRVMPGTSPVSSRLWMSRYLGLPVRAVCPK